MKVVSAGGFPALDEGGVDVDEVLEREAGVDEVLHHLLAVPLHVVADAVAVVGHLVHHLAICLTEADVVLEEVVMAINVSHDELLVNHLIAAQEVGIAGVVVDDHLVDFLQAVAVSLGELFVLHAEPPVGVAGGEPAEGGDFGEFVVVQNLEDRRIEVEPVGFRVGLDLDLEVSEDGGQVVVGDHGCHGIHLGTGSGSVGWILRPFRW